MESNRYTKEEAIYLVDMLDDLGEKISGLSCKVSSHITVHSLWLMTAGRYDEFLESLISAVFMSRKFAVLKEVLFDTPLEAMELAMLPRQRRAFILGDGEFAEYQKSVLLDTRKENSNTSVNLKFYMVLLLELARNTGKTPFDAVRCFIYRTNRQDQGYTRNRRDWSITQARSRAHLHAAAFELPLEEMPLLINCAPDIVEIAKWRLKIVR